MSLPYFRVRNWTERYENNRSREIKKLEYVLVPNTMDTDGYTALMDHPNGAAHLGAWIAILQIASRSKERGALTNSEGRPHTARTLARISRIPANVFEELLPRLLSEELQWIECVGESPQEGAGIPQDGATPTRAPDLVEFSNSTVQVNRGSAEGDFERPTVPVEPESRSLAIVSRAEPDPNDPNEIVRLTCELYAAGGVPVPISVQTFAVAEMVRVQPPERRQRLPLYVAWAFHEGRWSSVAKTKSLKNLLLDGDWDVEPTKRVLPKARDPDGKQDADKQRIAAMVDRLSKRPEARQT